MSEFTIYSDGGSRGNPGDAAMAFFIFSGNGEVVDFGGEYIGIVSNNVAEYMGLIAGLEKASKLKLKNIVFKMDSELIVKQMNGIYKVKHPDMQDLHSKVQILLKKFDTCKFVHIPRNENKFSDQLVNLILDCRL